MAGAEVAGVEVPDRCPADGAAGAGFFAEAFDDFIGEVAAVELGDTTHDALEEHPARCLVDVFAGGDEADALLDELGAEGDFVGSVTREAVKLVDDDEVDVVAFFFEVAKHLLESWPVCGGARDPALNELFDDHCPQ